MSTKDTIIKDGKVLEALMGGLFRIELDGDESQTEVFGALSGKMRKFKIRIMPGDRIKVEFSPHDLTRGRISYRYR
jgi:translation initiation factor IF-1